MNKNQYQMTDLALEAIDASHIELRTGGFRMTTSSLGGERIITLHTGDISSSDRKLRRTAAHVCADALKSFIPNDFRRSIAPVTVICLGNGSLTADSLGPLCSKRILATRHLRTDEPELFIALGGREISVVLAGVASETGVNAAELAKMCVKHLPASLLITVDALKASKAENLVSVVQIRNGVTPGSGVGNDRPEICRESMGVPVISIGVPTVISSLTLADEIKKDTSIAPTIHHNSKNTAYHPRRSASDHSLLVSRADCDTAVNAYAKIIADAINFTFLGTFYD